MRTPGIVPEPRRLLIGAIAGAFALTGFVSPAMALTGGELAEKCAGYPETGRTSLCELYVSSLRDFANSDDRMVNPRGKLCIPADTPIGEIITLVNDWLASHPELHARSGYEAAYGALDAPYRCR